MKTVGKQLQEARLARNWTPELAARETKIKVERLRDLEADDYSHFSSPAYARGFLRTYARSLGLDEYRILRQMDNKLPEDDNSSFVPDTGLPPELQGDTHVSTNRTGLYVVLGLGAGVMLIISFVLFEAYRAGELQSLFADNTGSDTAVVSPVSTNAPPAKTDATAETRALPADPNAPVPPAVDVAPTNSVAATDTNGAPGVAAAGTNGEVSPPAVRALPVDANDLTNAPALAAVGSNPDNGSAVKPPPRALPVDLNAATDPAVAGAIPAIPLSPNATNAPPPTMAHDAASLAAAAMSSKGHSSALFVAPTPVPAVTNAAPLVPAQALNSPTPDKHLILTASRDSFVRVTAVDAPDLEQVRFASVLHAGQSVGFDGRKFSVNVGIPSAVDITLDGVNYGPHSDQEMPETFTVESHQP